MAESKGIWFVAGLTLGAVAALLYAPQSGQETRELLSRRADEGRDLLQRKTTAARDQATQLADRGKQAVTRHIDQFQAAVEAGKQAYRETAGMRETDGGESRL